MATLNWLPVEALLINFESAHGAAGLASRSDPIWGHPPPCACTGRWAAAGQAPARPVEHVLERDVAMGWGLTILRRKNRLGEKGSSAGGQSGSGLSGE